MNDSEADKAAALEDWRENREEVGEQTATNDNNDRAGGR